MLGAAHRKSGHTIDRTRRARSDRAVFDLAWIQSALAGALAAPAHHQSSTSSIARRLSVLAPVLRASLSSCPMRSYGRIVAAFQFGMMTEEFPMGWLMDRMGRALRIASVAVLWWSAATGTQIFDCTGLQLGIDTLLDGHGRMRELFRWHESDLRSICSGTSEPWLLASSTAEA